MSAVSWWARPDVQRDRDAFRREVEAHLPEMLRPTEAELRRAEANAAVNDQWQGKFKRRGVRDE